MSKIAIAIHGGAGTILRSAMTPELEQEYRSGIEKALHAGWTILKAGGNSLDAVEAAVVSLEDFPLFNAGRGSVFTHDGKIEMDAAIMDGHSLRAGAIAFVKNIRNPVKLARLVMQKTEHVVLAGEGANQFAEEMRVKLEPDEYFFTEHRWLQLQEAIASGRVQLDHSDNPAETQRRKGLSVPISVLSASSVVKDLGKTPAAENTDRADKENPKSKIQKPKSLGTVGAVACDAHGYLAAATSTGGMTNKKFGRVGDTAIIGAGTYADANCAVSCTGHGEFFMLCSTAYDVAARMKYKGLSLEAAANETIEHLTEIGGEGGFIAIDSKGNVVLPFNSEGMYRGNVSSDGSYNINIYRVT